MITEFRSNFQELCLSDSAIWCGKTVPLIVGRGQGEGGLGVPGRDQLSRIVTPAFPSLQRRFLSSRSGFHFLRAKSPRSFHTFQPPNARKSCGEAASVRGRHRRAPLDLHRQPRHVGRFQTFVRLPAADIKAEAFDILVHRSAEIGVFARRRPA